jgi:hypothetical protein
MPLEVPVSFRQILEELKVTARFDGTDVEGGGAAAGAGTGKLECLDHTDGPELGRSFSTWGGGSGCNGTGTAGDVDPMIVEVAVPLVEEKAASVTDDPADVASPDGEDIDEDEGEGEISGGEGESISSLSSLTMSTSSTLVPTSGSNLKELSGLTAKLELSFFLIIVKLVFRGCPGRTGTVLMGDAVNEKSQESIVPLVDIADWRGRRSCR